MRIPSAPPRGTRDLLPPEVELRDQATAVILQTYRRFGFRRVETPALESIELLAGSEGGENEKLIYKILKRGEKLDLTGVADERELVDLGLRYDLTVPLARFYANNQGALPAPFKAVQVGPVWRAERPQKGRYRQFTQCDIDVLGDPSPLAEVELVLATTAALAALGLTGLTVRLNDRAFLEGMAASWGVPEDRRGTLFVALDKLDKIGLARVLEELEHVGFGARVQAGVSSYVEGWERVRERHDAASEIIARFCENPSAADPLDHVRRVAVLTQPLLPEGVRLAFDPTLVRGMGYYTGPIFEVGIAGEDFSIAGGGRYDRMIGRLLGRDVPAVGLSIGFERVVALLERQQVRTELEPLVALLHDAADQAAVLEAATALRAEGRAVSLLPQRKKVARQLDELRQQGFTGFVLFEPGRAQEVRTLADGAS